jgi:hypothetical protein
VSDAVPVELNRPQRAGRIIAQAFRLYRRYPLLFLTLALGVIGPYDVAVLAITGYGSLGGGSVSGRTALILTMLDWVVIGPLVSALHVHAVSDIREGRDPRLADVAWRGLLVLPVVAAATIASGLVIAVGFFFLIIPGVYLWLRWYVVAQATAMANEGGWFAGLGRSWRLSEDNLRHILAFVGLTFLVFVAVGIAGGAIRGAVGDAPEFIAGVAIHTFTASFVALTTACLYYDLIARSGLVALEDKSRPPVVTPPRPDEPATEFEIQRSEDVQGRDWDDVGTSRGAGSGAVEQALLTAVDRAGVYRVRRAEVEGDPWEYYFVVPETGHVHRRAPL